MAVRCRASGGSNVEYPESDGSLIAESDWHRQEIYDLIDRLKMRYVDSPTTYVTGHMFVYHAEGGPQPVFAPDVMVVFGVPDLQRRVFKQWDEGQVPAVVFEVSSRKTRHKDGGPKRALRERLGIDEYFLWDPRHEYLTPPLQGYRLEDGAYDRIPPDPDGCLASVQLGVRVCGDRNRLELYDAGSGQRLRAVIRRLRDDKESAAR